MYLREVTKLHSNNSRITDTIQLQQKIIYFKSELTKYQAKVKDYENNYHYSQLKVLKEENLQLMDEKEAISLELKTSREDYEKTIADLRSKIETHAEQEQSYNSTLSQKQQEIEKLKKDRKTNEKELKIKIDHLTKEKQTSLNKISELESFLQKSNKERDTAQHQLTEEIQRIKNELHNSNNTKTHLEKDNHKLKEEIKNLTSKIIQLEEANTINKDLELLVSDYESKLEEALQRHQQHEEAISEFKQENSKLKTITSQLEHELTENKKQNNELSEKVLVLQEISDNYTSLQKTHEILKEEMKTSQDNLNEMFIKFNESNWEIDSLLPKNTSQITTDTDINELDILKQLEYQFKELLEQSFDYEEQLDSKFLLINELENKLTELTNEIAEIQNNIHQEESNCKQ